MSASVMYISAGQRNSWGHQPEVMALISVLQGQHSNWLGLSDWHNILQTSRRCSWAHAKQHQ